MHFLKNAIKNEKKILLHPLHVNVVPEDSYIVVPVRASLCVVKSDCMQKFVPYRRLAKIGEVEILKWKLETYVRF